MKKTKDMKTKRNGKRMNGKVKQSRRKRRKITWKVEANDIISNAEEFKIKGKTMGIKDDRNKKERISKAKEIQMRGK